MASGKRLNGRVVALAALLALVIAFVAGYVISMDILKSRVARALGPRGEIRDIRVGWRGVEVEGLRIKSEKGWPAEEILKADRVTIVPSPAGLFTGDYRISSITITNPYLSIYRAGNGKIRVVPSLMPEKKQEAQGGKSSGKSPLIIGSIIFRNGVVEFYDATVSRIPLKIRLEEIQARMDNLGIPPLDRKNEFSLAAKIKGNRQDGQVLVTGWADMTTRDASVHLRLSSVDLTALQPYLIQSNDSRVKKGSLDLDLQSDVRSNRLKAPGVITLSDLKLAPARGMFGTFMGVPRDAVIGMMKDRGDRITLHFILEGDVRNPRFSLRETLTQRLAVSMADSLKVSVGGVVKGAGSLGQKGVESATGLVKGIEGTVQGLFGKNRK